MECSFLIQSVFLNNLKAPIWGFFYLNGVDHFVSTYTLVPDNV